MKEKLLAWRHRAACFLMQWLVRFLCLICVRPRMTFSSPEAKANFPKGPCVLISNHVYGEDSGPIETRLHHKHFYGMMAIDVMDGNKFLHWFLSYMPIIRLDRRNVSMAWLREGRKKLREGHSIFMCPEGLCNVDKVISEFKPGFVALAATANVPVVPIYHNAEFNYFHGEPFRMIIGEPIHLTTPPEGLTDEFMRQEAARATEIVRALEKQLLGFNRTKESAALEAAAKAKKAKKKAAAG